MAYLIIIALVVIAIVLIAKAAGKKKETDRNVKTVVKPGTGKPGTGEPPKPHVHPGGGGRKEPPMLYAYSAAGSGIWVCKACETENPQGVTQCCVCHANR